MRCSNCSTVAARARLLNEAAGAEAEIERTHSALRKNC